MLSLSIIAAAASIRTAYDFSARDGSMWIYPFPTACKWPKCSGCAACVTLSDPHAWLSGRANGEDMVRIGTIMMAATGALLAAQLQPLGQRRLVKGPAHLCIRQVLRQEAQRCDQRCDERHVISDDV